MAARDSAKMTYGVDRRNPGQLLGMQPADFLRRQISVQSGSKCLRKVAVHLPSPLL
jgi:hypothetical protein